MKDFSGILDWQNQVLLQGGASDIEIPEKEQAENIKQLLMGKFKNCK
jgi:hypothetical protein